MAHTVETDSIYGKYIFLNVYYLQMVLYVCFEYIF